MTDHWCLCQKVIHFETDLFLLTCTYCNFSELEMHCRASVLRYFSQWLLEFSFWSSMTFQSFADALYADDTQLFFSICPPNFDSNITHLQKVLPPISSWMTASLLTVKSSKIEFLLIGLKKKLDKMHNSSLHPLCSQPWLHPWWTSYLLRPNFSHLQSLLLPY